MTRSPPTFLFRAVGIAAALFVLTVFVMIAALFSDPDLPISRWLNRYSLPLLLGEVVLLLALGFAAMITDRPSASGQWTADGGQEDQETKS